MPSPAWASEKHRRASRPRERSPRAVFQRPAHRRRFVARASPYARGPRRRYSLLSAVYARPERTSAHARPAGRALDQKPRPGLALFLRQRVRVPGDRVEQPAKGSLTHEIRMPHRQPLVGRKIQPTKTRPPARSSNGYWRVNPTEPIRARTGCRRSASESGPLATGAPPARHPLRAPRSAARAA